MNMQTMECGPVMEEEQGNFTKLLQIIYDIFENNRKFYIPIMINDMFLIGSVASALIYATLRYFLANNWFLNMLENWQLHYQQF